MIRDLFSVERNFQHGGSRRVGILIAQLGTPAAPTARAVRPYLRQFLSDPRVIELSRPFWWLILNLFVLTFRPRASAKLYSNIWTDAGSPLLVISQRIIASISARLAERVGTPTRVTLGMTYGEPSIPKALGELKAHGCERILVFPLFSHYSSTSTGAAFDSVMKELMSWRRVPEVRTIHQYHDDPAYIRALADSVRRAWAEEGPADLLVTSYHGIPKRYFLNGDPYHCQCHKTTRLLAQELGLSDDRILVTFQSLFGREEWLQPYTETTLEALARTGARSVDVLCPGFSVDCLETLDEIDREYREVFIDAGGEKFRYIPCLNDQTDHIELLVDLIERNLGDWVQAVDLWDEEAAVSEAELSRSLAEDMKSRPVFPDAGLEAAQEKSAPQNH